VREARPRLASLRAGVGGGGLQNRVSPRACAARALSGRASVRERGHACPCACVRPP
jgi:hypothetical protein